MSPISASSSDESSVDPGSESSGIDGVDKPDVYPSAMTSAESDSRIERASLMLSESPAIAEGQPGIEKGIPAINAESRGGWNSFSSQSR